MNIPAYLVLRFIAITLVIIGIASISVATSYALSTEIVFVKVGLIMPIIGVFLILIAGVGPLRVMLHGAQIPIEIKRMIAIQAVLLPLSGVSFISAGILDLTVYGVWVFLIIGICAFISALAGFYPLSKTFPATFYISEMVSIIKSTGITSDKANSKADQAFQRWTKGHEGIQIGTQAADGTVITMNGEEVMLSSFFGVKPLVLNFGSYSCPHHRKRIAELHALMEKWKHQGVAFLTVYTAEAHAEDGWKLVDQYINDAEYTHENDFCFPYAKDINEREKMAEWLIDKKHFEMPIALDSMEDNLLKAYNSWPIRLYIIHNGKVAYCGKQGPFGYNPASIDMALRKLMKSNAQIR